MNVPAPASSFPDGGTIDVCVDAHDALYPDALRILRENAPPRVWMRGAAAVLATRPRVAIVGTRRATSYGLRVTAELARAFARAGACVVSGLARGIDGAAHRATLDAGGATIAVLGTGFDHVFPKGHRDLQREIGKRGLLLTELEPELTGRKFTFPMRNRLIAALADLTIVVEAGDRSGALITAGHAIDLDRPTAAVPGPIDQPQSSGTNRLIASGAHIIASVADAIALAGLTPATVSPRGDPNGDEGLVWTALAHGGIDMDTLCHLSGLPAARCLVAVTHLELAGAIECALTGEIRRR